MTGSTSPPVHVSAEISRRKLERELADWHAVEDSYARRGYWIIRRDDLVVDVAFLAQLTLQRAALPLVAAIARFDFANYDLWPASVTFIHPLTRETGGPVIMPVESDGAGGLVELVLPHPVHQRAFLCVRGTREYHDHPQHSGDDWLLYRGVGDGRLAVLCERLWRGFTESPLVARVAVLFPPPPAPMQVAVELLRAQLVPGDGQPPAPTDGSSGKPLAGQP